MHGEVEVSKKPEANEKSKKSLEFNLVEEWPITVYKSIKLFCKFKA
jgi:hypothetical protein